MGFKLRNIAFEIEITVFGRAYSIDLVPFRWQKRVVFAGTKNMFPETKGWHFYGGPIHVWVSSGWSAIFEIRTRLDQNPFHDGPLSIPPDKGLRLWP